MDMRFLLWNVRWQKVNMVMVLSEFIKSIWIKFMIFKYIIKLYLDRDCLKVAFTLI